MLLFLEHSIGGTQDDKLRASVQLITDILLFWLEVLDKLFRKHVSLMEERMFFRQFFLDGLGLFLTITHRTQSFLFYSMFNEISYYGLCSSLRELLVVLCRTAIVTMGT